MGVAGSDLDSQIIIHVIPRFEMYQAQERSCVPVRKAAPIWRGARDDCAWLLSAGYIDGYTTKITIRRIVLNQ
jgi:hypothetical protein